MTESKRNNVWLMLVLLTLFGCSKNPDTYSERPILSVEQLFQPTNQLSFSISPDGNHIAYILKRKFRDYAVYKNLTTNDSTVLSITNVTDLSFLTWKDNQQLVGVGNDNTLDRNRIFVIDRKKSIEKGFTFFNQNIISVNSKLDLDSFSLIIQSTTPKNYSSLYKLNVISGSFQPITDGFTKIKQWLVNENGEPLLAIESQDSINRLLRINSNGTVGDTVYEWRFPDFFQLAYVDESDSTKVYGITNVGTDKKSLVQFDIQKRNVSKTVFNADGYDISDVFKLGICNKCVVINWYDRKKQSAHLEPIIQSAFEKFKTRFEDEEVSLVSMDANRSKLIFKVVSDRQREEYFLYRNQLDSIEQISNNNQNLSKDFLNEQTFVEFTSRDGITLRGYLTLPIGDDEKGLPVVILPNSNPWSSIKWGYNPVVQFLANRGYAVLQINCRGSLSLGKEYYKSSFKEWGRGMQNDISDGVRYLVKNGIVNQNRIAIMGEKYGGYSALAGITFTPDLYSCAIAINPIVDLKRVYTHKVDFLLENHSNLGNLVGDLELDKNILDRYSPNSHTEQIKTPLLLFSDSTINNLYSKEIGEFVTELRWERVDVASFPIGSSTSSLTETKAYMERIETFLNDHLQSGNK